jgi:tetraprenyl-beta-curcumene synthase
VEIPKHPFMLMRKVYKEVMPIVHEELLKWKKKASNIPNEELRTQALASINDKTFHCEGGSIMGLLACGEFKKAIRFIVAYQTISDYLDNLCDRSTSLDPLDFAALHESMPHALTPHATLGEYYRYREDQNDGGYLHALVQTCQEVLASIEHYPLIKSHLLELCRYYCDLQIHKHVREEERVHRLETWFHEHQEKFPNMTWYEFSACAGSTLGIFCLVSYSFQRAFTKQQAMQIMSGYFPYIQGLHILLDYFIDQEEDEEEGDLNFCFYYPEQEEMMKRFYHFVSEADKKIKGLPHEHFHHFINRGLLGLYLSDRKVKKQRNVHKQAKKIIKLGGKISRFFYWNGRLYRILQKSTPH